MYKHLFRIALGVVGILVMMSFGVVNAQEINKDIELEATTLYKNATLKINKYFANAYTVDWGDGTTENLTSDITHTYPEMGTYTIKLSLTGTASRWTFKDYSYPLVPRLETSMTGVKITYMPSLSDGFGESSTDVGDNFFKCFNRDGKITSLPEGSFNTSNITKVGKNFFSNFNDAGQLTSLPIGSFNTSNITGAGDNFFSYFNRDGKLTSLSTGAFNLSISIVGNNFFYYFNGNGGLKSLPGGSFVFSGVTTVGDNFFGSFNSRGKITNLPEGSFNLSGITTVGNGFFSAFNFNGAIASLPAHSFNTTSITTVGNNFFSSFNNNGKITNLPEGSFNLSGITIVKDNFFWGFNRNGSLTKLSTGSFNTSNITKVGNGFFADFNNCGDYKNGKLTSLPAGSFNISNIVEVGDKFFYQFNYYCSLTSLPTGSFDTSHITTVGNDFFYSFNQGGKLTSLPDSFKLSSVGASVNSGYKNAFNSQSYTINKKVSDLVSGVTVPLSDMDTFSNNQPGRCGVHANWLVTTTDACNVTYNSSLGSTDTITKRYAADTTEVVAGSGIKHPIKNGYIFVGWYTSSEGGENIEIIQFPYMDGKNVYAHWNECEDGYMADYTSTICVIREYSLDHNLKGGYIEDGEGNKHEGNLIINYVYDVNKNIYKPNITGNVKRENSEFIGWYSSDGEEVDIFNATGIDNSTIYAEYKCNGGYIENESGTACERIRVEFNANGGKFSDNSDIYSIVKSKQVPGEKMSVLHTANLNDNGDYTDEFSGQSINGYSTSLYPYTSGGITTYPISSPSIVYFKEENVEKFDISIKYGGSPYCNTPGYIIVWTGDHRQFDGNYNPGNTGLAILYIGDFPNYGENGEKSVEMEGDSFTIYQNGGCPSYGFFANISWIGEVDLTYEENAFDNIPEPTREGHKFVGWYLSDDTEFNTGNVSTGEITKVYAKRECADGYENKGGECVKKSSGSSGGGGGGGGGGSSSSSSTESNTPDVTPSQSAGTGANSSTGTQNDQTTTGTNINEPEGTGNNAEIQTGSQVDSNTGSIVSSGTNVNNLDTETSNDSTTSSQNDDKTYSTEFQQAYEFAKGNGITTMPTIQKANMEGKLTRIAMAKMLSQYAMNVLGQKPANIVTPKFNDVTDKMDTDYDDGVTLAYQLGIMGQNMPGNNFRPNDEVTRAEFATALSRMAYGTSDGEYKGTGKYYIHHMEKLVKEGIITKDDPNMKELRGYVMIMLMRSAK